MDEALVLTGPRRFARRPVRLADPEAGSVIVVPQWTGLCGTDLHVADGHHPRVRFPVALGHELVGLATTGTLAGQVVFVDPTLACGECPSCRRGIPNVCDLGRVIGIDLDGALGGALSVDPGHIYAIPPGLPPWLGTLAEPLAVAVHAVRRSGLLDGDDVVVVGAGPVGLLVAEVARRRGGRVLVSEVSPERRRTALALRFELLDVDDPLSDLLARTQNRGCDHLVDAAAASALAATLPAWVRSGGTISIVGIHRALVPVDLRAILYKELTLLGDRVYVSADIAEALDILAHDGERLGSLVTDRVGIEDVPSMLERMRAGAGLKTVVALSF